MLTQAGVTTITGMSLCVFSLRIMLSRLKRLFFLSSLVCVLSLPYCFWRCRASRPWVVRWSPSAAGYGTTQTEWTGKNRYVKEGRKTRERENRRYERESGGQVPE